MLPSLKQLQEQIKKTVKGQDKATNKVCTAFYKYLIKLIAKKDFSIEVKHPSIILLKGNTGVGKTFLIKEVSNSVGLPFIEMNAKSIAQENWEGRSFLKLIEQNLHHLDSKYNRIVTSAVIFIDEFDKLTTENTSSKSDNVNIEIQSGLLKYLEGFNTTIGKRIFNFSECMFVLAGSFNEVNEKVTKTKQIGFNSISNNLEITRQLFIDCGLLPELAGRIQEYVELEPISKEVFNELLQTPTFLNCLWNEILLKMDLNVILNNEEIINNAIKFNLGVRGLIQAIEEEITEFLNTNVDLIDIERFNVLSQHRLAKN